MTFSNGLLFILILWYPCHCATNINVHDDMLCPFGTDLFDGKTCQSLRDYCKKSHKIVNNKSPGSCSSCPDGEGPNIDGTKCEKDVQMDESNKIQLRNGKMSRILKFVAAEKGLINDLYMDPRDHSSIIESTTLIDPIYFALFSEDGTHLEEINGHIRKSRNKKLSVPDATTANVENAQNPSFLFMLTNNGNGACQRLYTSTGLKIVAQQDKKKNFEIKFLQNAADDNSDCWNIYKWENRFYIIESKKFPGNFWKSTSNSLNLVTKEKAELFSGYKANFMISLDFDRSDHSASNMEEIKDLETELYGDIVATYFLPNGTKAKGYICDYQWTTRDAEVFCQDKWQLSGFPLYDGHFTPAKENVNFVMTMVNCDNSEKFDECKIYSECPENGPYICQRSLNMYSGQALGCKQKGSNADIAGAVCGEPGAIRAKVREFESAKFKCKRGKEASDKKSIGEMFSLESQGNKANDVMTKNKHWSEYLTPVPMTVSLLSMLLLISAQFERVIYLQRPSSGQWKHLEWDTLQPNLQVMKNLMISGFETSSRSMLRVYTNSKEMNNELERSVKYAYMPDETMQQKSVKLRLLAHSMKVLTDLANENVEKCANTVKKFDDTSAFIGELITAVSQTHILNVEEKKVMVKSLERNIKKKETKETELKNTEKELQKLKIQEKQELKKFFDEAKAETQKSCLMTTKHCNATGVQRCNKCVSKPGFLDKSVCEEWGTRKVNCERKCKENILKCANYVSECFKYENQCVEEGSECNGYSDGECVKWGKGDCINKSYCWSCVKTICTDWNEKCIEHKQVCTNHKTTCKKYKDVCVLKENVCKSQSESCKEYETTCQDQNYCKRYKWVPEGRFCQDPGKEGSCCSSCADVDRIQSTIQSVVKTSTDIAMRGLGDEKKTMALQNILFNLFEDLQYIETKIETRETQIKEAKQTKSSSDAKETTPSPNDSQCENDCEQLTKETENLDQVISENAPDPGLDLTTDLAVMKKTLPMQIKQVKVVSLQNPLGKEVLLHLEKLNRMVIAWTRAGRYKMLLNEDIKEILKIIDGLKLTQEKVEQEAADKAVHPGLEKDGVNIGSAQIGQLGISYINTQIERKKESDKAEFVSAIIEQAIDEMASQEIQINDYKSAIDFLVKCSKHLDKLRDTWSELGTFFVKIGEMLNSVQGNTKQMSALKDILVETQLSSAETIITSIRESVVSAYSKNMYVIKVADFYNEIMDNGLLSKLRLLRFDRCTSPNCVDNIRKFLKRDCIANQRKIAQKIRLDQAAMNKKMMIEIEALQNFMACTEESHTTPEGKKALEAVANAAANLNQMNKQKPNTQADEPAKEAPKYNDPKLSEAVKDVTQDTFDKEQDLMNSLFGGG